MITDQLPPSTKPNYSRALTPSEATTTRHPEMEETVALRGRKAVEGRWLQVRTLVSRWIDHVELLHLALIATCLVLSILVVRVAVRNHRGSPAAAPAGDAVPDTQSGSQSLPPDAQAEQKVLLVECPVCKQPVDPARSKYEADVNHQSVFFDRFECLQAFQADPVRYARVRVHVRITPNDLRSSDREPAADPGLQPAPPQSSDMPSDPANEPKMPQKIQEPTLPLPEPAAPQAAPSGEPGGFSVPQQAPGGSL